MSDEHPSQTHLANCNRLGKIACIAGPQTSDPMWYSRDPSLSFSVVELSRFLVAFRGNFCHKQCQQAQRAVLESHSYPNPGMYTILPSLAFGIERRV